MGRLKASAGPGWKSYCKSYRRERPYQNRRFLDYFPYPRLMRCGDLSKCTGAILGKALEPLEEGTGVIMAQVTLR